MRASQELTFTRQKPNIQGNKNTSPYYWVGIKLKEAGLKSPTPKGGREKQKN
jgi:hypothetical protein